MTTVTFYKPASMDNLSVWYANVDEYSASEITLTDYQGRYATYYGSFSFTPSYRVMGTLTGYREWDATGLSYTVSGGHVSAAAFQNAMEGPDPAAAHRMVLAGNDTFNGSPYDDYLMGWTGNDALYGNAGSDSLDGGSGADTLDGGAGADSMAGGAGNDTYIVDDAGDVVSETTSPGNGLDAGGIDTVKANLSFTLGAFIENLTLTGTGNFSGSGNALANTLIGNDGDNRLDGGAGADILAGGAGNDTYVVDNAGDKVYETTKIGNAADAGGVDTVEASVGYTLGRFVENLLLTGSATLNGSGNELANHLTGNSGNNVLDGKGGADSLDGREGADTYLIAALADYANGEVIADSGLGADIDEIRLTAAAGTLVLSSQVSGIERVVVGSAKGAVGVNAVALTDGIELDGNAGANVLTGTAHADLLVGGAGNDRLDGGAGADHLVGGLGKDTYVVDDAGDTISEDAGAAGEIDTVEAGLGWTLGANLENLILTGTGNFNGSGNALANTLTGNGGNNRLDGGAGADILVGGAGDDTYVVDNVGDKVYETTRIGNAADAGGSDTVEAGISYTLGNFVEKLVLTGSATLTGTGNALANLLQGNDSDNVLKGLAGSDTLDGRGGNDLLVGGLGNDELTGGAGSDHFRFDALLGGAGNVDILHDFSVGDDRIELENGIFTKLKATGTLGEGNFHAADGAVAQDADDYILYDSASGALSYDADGSGAKGPVQFATLVGHPALSAADFLVT